MTSDHAESPEEQQFIFPSFWKRAYAYFFDCMLISTCGAIVYAILIYATWSTQADFAMIREAVMMSIGLAWFHYVVAIALPMFSLIWMLGVPSSYTLLGLANYVAAALGPFFLGSLYYALMESSRYKGTIGKRLMGMHVSDLSGNRLNFKQAFIRYLAKSVSSAILMSGFIMAAKTKQKQALHDMLAKTLVLKDQAILRTEQTFRLPLKPEQNRFD